MSNEYQGLLDFSNFNRQYGIGRERLNVNITPDVDRDLRYAANLSKGGDGSKAVNFFLLLGLALNSRDPQMIESFVDTVSELLPEDNPSDALKQLAANARILSNYCEVEAMRLWYENGAK